MTRPTAPQQREIEAARRIVREVADGMARFDREHRHVMEPEAQTGHMVCVYCGWCAR